MKKMQARGALSMQIFQTVVLLLTLLGLPELGSGQETNGASRLILVSGATGTQGGAVARELLSRGYTVRGLTRNLGSEAAMALTDLGVQMVLGDFDDPASLDAALEGAYGAFSVQQPRGIGAEGEIRQGKQFAASAKRAGIQHFVYSSVFEARFGSGIPQFDSKWEIENYIRSLGIPYSIIRPSGFMTNLEGARESATSGVYRTAFPAAFPRFYIAPRDIGRFVAEAFDHPDAWIGRELDVAGERATCAEVAATMSDVIGRAVIYEQIPWEEYMATATPIAITMDAWFMQNDPPLDIDALRREFSWLISLKDYLRDAGWADGGR